MRTTHVGPILTPVLAPVLAALLASGCQEEALGSLEGATAAAADGETSGTGDDAGEATAGDDDTTTGGAEGTACVVDEDCLGDLICDPWTSTCQSTPSDLCGEQTPIIRNGKFSGFHECEDGTVRRVEAVECADPLPSSLPACVGDEDVILCESDADCTAYPNLEGHCIRTGALVGPEYNTVYACSCQYTCKTDADCGDNRMCHCPSSESGVASDEAFPYCAYAGCNTDDDCEHGECGLSAHYTPYGSYISALCREPDDECRTDADCTQTYFGSCVANNGWECASYY